MFFGTQNYQGALEQYLQAGVLALLPDTPFTLRLVQVALMAAAILLAISHVRASRGKALPAPASAIIAVFVVVAAVATSVQVYRIGHSGAESVWGDALTSSPAGESED